MVGIEPPMFHGAPRGDLVVQMLQNPKPSAVVAFSLSGSNFWLPFVPITIASLFQKQCCYCMTDMRKKITSIYFEMIQVQK